MDTEQQLTAPYTPQENPTERANRTVKTMIAQFAGQDQKNWDEKWPEVMLAVNTSVSESTCYTPSFITQDREPRFPTALYDRETLGTGRPTETPEEKANKLRDIFEIVRRNLEKTSQDQVRHYNFRRRQWKPAMSDVVWAKEHHLSKAAEAFAAKLAPRYDGTSKDSPRILRDHSNDTPRILEGHSKDAPRMTSKIPRKKTPRTLQGHSRETPRMLQGPSKDDPRILQGHYRETPRIIQGHYKITPGTLQRQYRVTPKMLQEHYRDTPRIIQGH